MAMSILFTHVRQILPPLSSQWKGIYLEYSWLQQEREFKAWFTSNSPGLFSSFLPRLPQSRTLEMRMRICFWQSDLLLLGQGLRLLEICRLALGSLTSLRCRISELARAAILLCPAHPWGAKGVSGLPTSLITQDHGGEERRRQMFGLQRDLPQ